MLSRTRNESKGKVKNVPEMWSECYSWRESRGVIYTFKYEKYIVQHFRHALKTHSQHSFHDKYPGSRELCRRYFKKTLRAENKRTVTEFFKLTYCIIWHIHYTLFNEETYKTQTQILWAGWLKVKIYLIKSPLSTKLCTNLCH